ncbi:hypothetical protein C882_3376 [Caenispirillum salinarum AK4]|uniref:Uncharacterized protein n=1 Tax=Caenispirillum salinarum AK4 TaxID=1238182 RepID=K9HAZ8_9PROT|nr:hypothetical protein C882_3376 [Caenispirillum salinarum AK4]
MLVHAFARDADDGAQLLLRQLHVDAHPRARGNAEGPHQVAQGPRQPGRRFQEQGVLQVRACAAQALAQDSQKPPRDLGVGLQMGQEGLALEHQQVAGHQGGGIGRAGLAVQQADLAEHLSGADDVEDQFLAVGGIGGNLHLPARDRDHAVAGIAALEDHLPAFHTPGDGLRRETPPRRLVEGLQQAVVRQDDLGVDGRHLRHGQVLPLGRPRSAGSAAGMVAPPVPAPGRVISLRRRGILQRTGTAADLGEPPK